MEVKNFISEQVEREVQVITCMISRQTPHKPSEYHRQPKKEINKLGEEADDISDKS